MPPKKSLKYTAISKAAFDDILSRYPATVPVGLRELDALRYDAIPAAVLQRARKSERLLKKDEVEKLVEWKLKHGTFRPSLLQLVQSNSHKDIEKITRKAFGDTPGDGNEWMFGIRRDSPMNFHAPLALKDLTKLKGIGPATASLLLSTSDPVYNPFFSDELFRWLMWDAPGNPGGWKRAIKYNAREYDTILQRFNALNKRLGIRAVDAERVAWVLGKNDIDVSKGEDESLSKLPAKADGEEVVAEVVQDIMTKPTTGGGGRKGGKRKAAETEDDEGEEDGVEETVRAPKAKKTKRKSVEPKAPAEGVQKSTRRKTT